MTNNPSKKLYSDDIVNMLKHIKSIGQLPDNISWHSTKNVLILNKGRVV